MKYVRCRICDSKIFLQSTHIIEEVTIKYPHLIELIDLINENNLHTFNCPYCEYTTESFVFLNEGE